MNPDTIVAINSAIKSAGGLRKAAAHLKVSAGTLSDIVNSRHEHVSLRAENNVRAALGLPTLHYHTVPACPDCGAVHTGRCHGRAVEVRPVRKPRPISRWADASVRTLAHAIAQRTEYAP